MLLEVKQSFFENKIFFKLNLSLPSHNDVKKQNFVLDSFSKLRNSKKITELRS